MNEDKNPKVFAIKNAAIIEEALAEFAKHNFANITISKFDGEIRGYQISFEKRFSKKTVQEKH